eukprot:SAG22_NODE_6550_length_840_cov_1.468286_1_plen_51_part_10
MQAEPEAVPPPAPQYLILGAQKCGTTALWVRLAGAQRQRCDHLCMQLRAFE